MFFWTQATFLIFLLSLLPSCIKVHWNWSKIVYSIRQKSSPFFKILRSQVQQTRTVQVSWKVKNHKNQIPSLLHKPLMKKKLWSQDHDREVGTGVPGTSSEQNPFSRWKNEIDGFELNVTVQLNYNLSGYNTEIKPFKRY